MDNIVVRTYGLHGEVVGRFIDKEGRLETVVFEGDDTPELRQILKITFYKETNDGIVAKEWEDSKMTGPERFRLDITHMCRLLDSEDSGEWEEFVIQHIALGRCGLNMLVESPLSAVQFSVNNGGAFDSVLDALKKSLSNGGEVGRAMKAVIVAAEKIYRNRGDNMDVINSNEFAELFLRFFEGRPLSGCEC